MSILKLIREFIHNKRGSPLIEQGLLLGLAILTITILITVILDVMGWSQGLIQSIIIQLDLIRQALFGGIG
ncbi:MAG: hypothetical protein ACFFD8_00015 [Candidatus Thorarchaeota archaeon]